MLHELPKITIRQSKRLGRGIGSAKGGHTVGRGTKGHRSRQGKPIPLWFEGGQLPLIKRLPYWRGKFRFKSLNIKPITVTMSSLVKLASGQAITPETLKVAGLVRTQYHPIKIVGSSDKLPKFSEVRGVQMSATAKQTFEKAGVSITA